MSFCVVSLFLTFCRLRRGDEISSFCTCSGEEHTLSWEDRLQIALDVSHGVEYLHDGVDLLTTLLVFSMVTKLVTYSLFTFLPTGGSPSDTS